MHCKFIIAHYYYTLLHGVSPPFLYALSPRSSAGSTDAEFGGETEDNQNSIDDNISDDGNEQQVTMLLYIAFILCIVQYSNTSYSFILID